MSHSNYKKIFSVSSSHSYFQKKTASPIVVQPSKSSIDLITQYAILLRQTTSGVELFCNAAESFESILRNIKEATGISSFDFDLKSMDPFFYCYTGLPSQEIQLVYSSDTKLNRNEKDTIVLHPKFIEGQNENRLGQIHIQFTDLIKFYNNNTPVTFTILFNSRSTQWQYFIINSGKFPLPEMSIETNSDIQFSSPKEIVLPNGQNAILFTSETLIPLSNLTDHTFNLIDSGKTIISGLPNPDVTTLTVDKSKEKTLYCSPMYIYV